MRSLFVHMFLIGVCAACAAPNKLLAESSATVTQRIPLGRRVYYHAHAISPDGKLLAVACGAYCQPGEVQLFSLSNGKRLATLTGHREQINCLAFTRDSRILISGGKENRCLIWRMADYKRSGLLKGAESLGMVLSISADGNTVATLDEGNRIAVWNLARQARLTTLKGHTDGAIRLAYFPDDPRLVVASNDGTLRLWEMLRYKATIVVSKAHKDTINDMAIKPGGSLIATCGNDGVVKVWDIGPIRKSSGVASLRRGYDDPERRGEIDEPLSLAFSPDGTRLATGYRSGKIVFYNTTVPEYSAVETITGHESDVTAIAFSPDGQVMVSGSYLDTSIVLWRIRSN